jgi:hypothetical protein
MIMEASLVGVAGVLNFKTATYRALLILVLDAFVCFTIIASLILRDVGSEGVRSPAMFESFLVLAMRIFALGITYFHWPCTDVGAVAYTAMERK